MIAGGLVGIIAVLVFLGCVICWIMVLIKQFKDAGAVHGIIGIITCSIWTLVWGWMNATRLNIKNIMMIWTLLLIICLVLRIFFMGVTLSMPTPAT